jgi:hypothetical protein
VQDVLDVYAAGGEDLDVPETVAVELPADLAHQVTEVAAAVARRVEPDGVDRVRIARAASSAPNFSSSKVSMMMVRGILPSDGLVEGL